MTLLRANGHQIVLPSAQFGDENVVDANLKLKKMMNGDKWSYANSIVHGTYSLKFQNVNRPKVEELRNFLLNTAGYDIEMIDHNNYLWKGRITNNPTTFTHAAIRDNQFNIEFEGHIFGEVELPGNV